ncbi:MAG: hypothetical protein ABI142_02355, partial [Bryocella sp.]
ALIDAFYGLHRWPKALIYLGKISYGLYVFHIAALGIAGHLHQGIAVGFILCVAMAAASYKFLESPFLRLKERFEIIPSRPVDGNGSGTNWSSSHVEVLEEASR